MNKKYFYIFLLIAFAFCLNGCLVYESKEYSFKLKNGNSGEGVIKFVNIMSQKNDTNETLETNYETLIEQYYNGKKIEDELTGGKNFSKRFYEEDNRLCAEIKFEFEDITKMKFYKYKDEGPWCYHIQVFSMGMMGGSEHFFKSNGEWGGETMPVIFWNGNNKKLEFTTTSTTPSEKTTSLLGLWKERK